MVHLHTSRRGRRQGVSSSSPFPDPGSVVVNRWWRQEMKRSGSEELGEYTRREVVITVVSVEYTCVYGYKASLTKLILPPVTNWEIQYTLNSSEFNC